MPLTKDEAVALSATKWWEKATAREIAELQLTEPLWCLDTFSRFHAALEEACGRPVFTHELGSAEGQERLLKEVRGEAPPATFDEILALIPPEKRVLAVVTR